MQSDVRQRRLERTLLWCSLLNKKRHTQDASPLLKPGLSFPFPFPELISFLPLNVNGQGCDARSSDSHLVAMRRKGKESTEVLRRLLGVWDNNPSGLKLSSWSFYYLALTQGRSRMPEKLRSYLWNFKTHNKHQYMRTIFWDWVYSFSKLQPKVQHGLCLFIKLTGAQLPCIFSKCCESK